MAGSESADTAQHHTVGHRGAAEEVQQFVGDEAVLPAQPLAEVGGQFQQFVAHSARPVSWPSQAAATPATMLTTMLAAAAAPCRSSASRWVSSIQVENVV